MKNSTKTLLFGGMGLFAIGMCIILITSTVYGTNKMYELASDGAFEIRFGNDSIGLNGVDHFINYISNDYYSDDSFARANKVDKDYIGNADEIDVLKLEVGGGTFKIEESEDDSYYVSINHTYKFEYGVKNETLYLSPKNGRISGSGTVTLYIPKDANLDQIKLSFGGGKLKLDSLSADDIKLEMGAGEAEINTIVADRLNLSMGAGKMEIEDMSVEELVLDMAMGELNLVGDVKDTAKVECAMGDFNMILKGDYEDFDYNIECGMGHVQVGEFSSSGIAFERAIDNNASKDFKLECAMGNVEVSFE